MLEIGGRLHFLDEPLGTQDRREFGAQDLDRHVAVVFQVLGQVDGGHAARAEFFLDGVAVCQGGFEALQLVAHPGLNYGLDENLLGGDAGARKTFGVLKNCVGERG